MKENNLDMTGEKCIHNFSQETSRKETTWETQP